MDSVVKIYQFIFIFIIFFAKNLNQFNVRRNMVPHNIGAVHVEGGILSLYGTNAVVFSGVCISLNVEKGIVC